jgi:hypothetical protein
MSREKKGGFFDTMSNAYDKTAEFASKMDPMKIAANTTS